MYDLNQQPLNYFSRLDEVIKKIDHNEIINLINLIGSYINSNNKLIITGNGGSAATSSHMVCDLSKTILGKTDPKSNTKRIKALSLNDNMPLITAWSNDDSFRYAFSEQLKNIGSENDLLIVITGSGNSENIIELIKTAKAMGVRTYGLLGFDGGKSLPLLDRYLLVPSDDYGVIEDIHVILVHLITDWFKKVNV